MLLTSESSPSLSIRADLASLRPDVALYGLFLWATAAFSRDFAWLHVRLYAASPYLRFFAKPDRDSVALQSPSFGLPIFVTDLCLALLLAAVVIRAHGRAHFGRDWFDKAFVLWVLVGAYELMRGVSASPMLSLRDFAIVYYAIFFYIARSLCSGWKNLTFIALAFWLGTVVSLSIGTYYYLFDVNFWPQVGIDWPASSQFMAGSYGVYLLVTILTGMALWRQFERTGQNILTAYLSVAVFALTFAQQRSLIIAFFVGLSILVVARGASALQVYPLWRLGGGVVAAGLILGVARFSADSPAHFFGPVRHLIAKTSTTVAVAAPLPSRPSAPNGGAAGSGAPDEGGSLGLTGTARFRQDAWSEAWKRFSAHPIVGEGFGRPFVFYDTLQRRWWTEDVRPHNTYLTILYKMGVLGLAAFALLHVAFFRALYRALGRSAPAIVVSALVGLTSALVAVQVYGLFNLLVESPFVAVVYWSVMGVIAALIQGDEASAALASARPFAPAADRLWYRLAKRVSDVGLAVLLLVLLAPLCVLIAVLIKMDSRGPVFFLQRRVGRDGREFVMYKFRTMHADTPPYAVKPSSRCDRRLTRAGRWLRRWSLDEVPQLINVLEGQMSLVGPRPEMPFIVAAYDDRQRQRLNVIPGVTGLWQISAVRAQQIHDHIEYDLAYIDRRSLTFDMAILLRTVSSVVRGNGAL